MRLYRLACLAAVLAMMNIAAQADNSLLLLEQIEQQFVALHETVGPCVVSIDVRNSAEASQGDMEDLFHYFNFPAPESGPRMPKPKGTGSGLIYDKEGHIVTNNHVVENAENIKVRLSNGKEYPGEVVGTDSETDLAVIKIAPEAITNIATLGDSDSLKVGQFAIAIGSARGFEGSVSFGHISALGREDLQGLAVQGLTFQHFIQTDAAINLGNSGGPLCNIRGEVIGINTAIVFGANSIGFAIPINTVKETIPQLISSGKVTRGYLGVAIDDASQYAKALELEDPNGAFVKRVEENTPASRAGIEAYDVIRKVNGKPILTARGLISTIASFPPGAAVEVEVWRKGEAKTFQVNLDERNLSAALDNRERVVLGLRVREVPKAMMEKTGLDPMTKGVIVVEIEPGSPAEDGKLLPGDIIIEAAQQPVDDPIAFETIVKEKAEPGKSMLIRFIRGNNEPDITTLDIPKP
jgi:serine protease Do